MSRQIRPLGSILKSASAPSNLVPPRLTNFCARLGTSICASAAMGVPALSVRLPSTWTSPARTMASASFKDPAIPRSTSRRSSRIRVALRFMMKRKATRMRLDLLLVERGIAGSLKEALAMVLAGEVQVDGKRTDKAGTPIAADAQIEVPSRAQKFVSRGGTKLEGALADFKIDPKGRICLDIGSSTGGFTDCLLHHGAARVYAVDVSMEQLDWKL